MIKRNFYFYNISSSFSNLISGLHWTGIPLLLVNVSNDVNNFSLLFIIQSAVGLVFSLFGGFISDLFGSKRTILYKYLGIFDFFIIYIID